MSNNQRSQRDKSKDLALLGTTIGEKYRVLELLGQGGFGSVFLVEMLAGMAGRKMALKVLPTELSLDESARKGFLNEMNIAMQMVNKYIVQIRDVGETAQGQLYFTMDYYPGETLARILKRKGRLEPGRAISIALRILDALAAAHSTGVIHRDLKPANVMVIPKARGETARVLDFGLATATRALKRGNTGIVGTRHYMSPEQFINKGLGPQMDIFSMGAILYECLAGQRPFRGKTPQEIFNDMMTRSPDPPDRLNPELDAYPGLSAAACKALDKDPELRFATAKDFSKELERIFRGRARSAPQPEKSQSPTTSGEKSPEKKRNKLLVSGFAILGAVMVTITISVAILKSCSSPGVDPDTPAPDPSVAVVPETVAPDTPVQKPAPPETKKESKKEEKKEEKKKTEEKRDDSRAEQLVADAWINFRAHKYQETIQLAQEAISLNPKKSNIADAKCLKGQALFELDRYEEAHASLESAWDMMGQPGKPEIISPTLIAAWELEDPVLSATREKILKACQKDPSPLSNVLRRLKTEGLEGEIERILERAKELEMTIPGWSQ